MASQLPYYTELISIRLDVGGEVGEGHKPGDPMEDKKKKEGRKIS